MVRTMLLVAFRAMVKHKVFIMINVFGMGMAIACCIVAYFARAYDKDFDRVHAGENIYRVGSIRRVGNTTERLGYCAMPLGEVAQTTFQDVSRSTRYVHSRANIKLQDNLFASHLSYVDPDFLELFNYTFVVGNASALSDKSAILLSETTAKRLFGGPALAAGRTLTLVMGENLKEARVAAVYREQPANSSFYRPGGSALMNFENYLDEYSRDATYDWAIECTLFLEIEDSQRLPIVAQSLQPFRESSNKLKGDFQVSEYTLDAFSSMAHQDRDNNVSAATWAAPPLAAIVGTVVMSVLILLIACFNLTNTAMAIYSRRLKEIGIRKVMGSRRISLVLQFMGETTMICLLSVLVGVCFADLLIEGWNMLTANNIRLTPNYLESPGFLIFLVGVTLFTGLAGGSYPAFYISRYAPVHILKGTMKLAGTNYFTRTLLTLQFSISLITIVSSVGMYRNAAFQESFDMGFEARRSINTWVGDRGGFDTYRHALGEHSDISAIAGARNGLFASQLRGVVTFDEQQVSVDALEVGDGYLDALGIELIAGRAFEEHSESDQQESVLVTRKLANQLGWRQSVGRQIRWNDTTRLYVIGVVDDIYSNGLWQEMEPMIIRYVLPDQYTQLVVTAKPGAVATVDQIMQKKWGEVFPNQLYNGYRLSSVLNHASALSMSIVYGYAFLSIIAIWLSVTGLYTLVSLNLLKRTREISIRRIVGASISSVIGTVNREFMIILLLAVVVGSYAGYSWCNALMSAIWRYHLDVSVLTLIMSGFALVAIAVLVVVQKVVRVTNLNPASNLRHE